MMFDRTDITNDKLDNLFERITIFSDKQLKKVNK